ncbi:MAG: hypothetical protein JNL70_04040 [Saprospiraceae bacterium]|nr:hypothetical protein [Saprospiraceae bacterium]
MKTKFLFVTFLTFFITSQLLAQWTTITGRGRDIGVSANGTTVWCLGWDAVPGGYSINKWNGSSWERKQGGAIRLDVDPQGNAWCVNFDGLIFKWEGNDWKTLEGRGRDIGVGADGTVWCLGWDIVPGGYSINKWNGSSWQRIHGGAVRIDVDPNGNAWGVNDQGLIFYWKNNDWVTIGGQGRDIGVGANGQVWLVGWNKAGSDYTVHKWTGSYWTNEAGGLTNISVGKDEVWGVNSNGAIVKQNIGKIKEAPLKITVQSMNLSLLDQKQQAIWAKKVDSVSTVPIFGDDCDDTQKTFNKTLVSYARTVVSTNTFADFLRRRMKELYIGCTNDPYANDDFETQYQKVLSACRAPLLIKINCTGGAGNASAGIGTYDNDWRKIPEFSWGGWFQDKSQCAIQNNCTYAPFPWPYTQAAGIIWHELMHQYGYGHGANNSDQNNIAKTACGIPSTNTSWNFQRNTIPYIVGNCIEEILDISHKTCGGLKNCPSSDQIKIVDIVGGNTCSCVTDPVKATASNVQTAWRYCNKCQSMFYDGYNSKGTCSVGGGHSASSYNFILPYNVKESNTIQAQWRFCDQCYNMFFDGYPDKGACAATYRHEELGEHEAEGFNFVLSYNIPENQAAQALWRYCSKCSMMFYNGYPKKGICTKGGEHVASGYNFVLTHDLPTVPPFNSYQKAWRYCTKCFVLYYDGYPQKGTCAGGGGHIAAGYNFNLPHDIPATPNTQAAWRFCRKCNGMFFDGYPQKGACPGTAKRIIYGGHHAQGYNFTLTHDVPSVPPFNTYQAAWRYCSKCKSMFYDGYPQKGVCISGGSHTALGYNFVLNYKP